MNSFTVAATWFIVGFICGTAYRKWGEDWTVRHVYRKFDDWLDRTTDGYWVAVILACAVILLGVVLWRDHARNADYYDCIAKANTASAIRAEPTNARDAAQTKANEAQQRVNRVLYAISLNIPLDGKPPTPQEQKAAIAAYTELGPATQQAKDAYRVLDQKQEALDLVREQHPIPFCGSAPS